METRKSFYWWKTLVSVFIRNYVIYLHIFWFSTTGKSTDDKGTGKRETSTWESIERLRMEIGPRIKGLMALSF